MRATCYLYVRIGILVCTSIDILVGIQPNAYIAALTFCFPKFSRDSSHRTPSDASPEVNFSARTSLFAVVSASSARRFFSPTVSAHCASRASTLSFTAFSSAWTNRFIGSSGRKVHDGGT